MKKILVIQPIHAAGIELFKKNKNYEFEVVENVDPENLKMNLRKILIGFRFLFF